MSAHPDDIKRLTDGYMDALMVDRTGRKGKWMAFALSDGSTSGVVFDTYKEAKKFNQDRPCLVLQLQPDGIRPKAAKAILEFHRGLWDAGLRLGDPDAPAAILPQFPIS